MTSGCTQINGQDLDALLPLSLSSLGMGLWFCFWLDAWRVKDDALRVRTVSLLRSGCGKTGQARRLNSSPSGNVRLQQSEGGRQKQNRQRHKQSRQWGSSSPGTGTTQERLGRRRGGVAGMQNGGNNATKEINLKFHHKRENEIT